ncbi:hypothetical protein V8C43DRAFT_280931 [Trichoderma afarasin]
MQRVSLWTCVVCLSRPIKLRLCRVVLDAQLHRMHEPGSSCATSQRRASRSYDNGLHGTNFPAAETSCLALIPFCLFSFFFSKRGEEFWCKSSSALQGSFSFSSTADLHSCTSTSSASLGVDAVSSVLACPPAFRAPPGRNTGTGIKVEVPRGTTGASPAACGRCPSFSNARGRGSRGSSQGAAARLAGVAKTSTTTKLLQIEDDEKKYRWK